MPGRGTPGDPGAVDQPGHRAVVAVVGVALPGGERGQEPGPRRRGGRIVALEFTQAFGLGRGAELAGVGGPDLPLEVSAIDSFPSATDAPERSLTIAARQEVSLARVLGGEELLCEVLDRCLNVSRYLLERAPAWLGD